MEKSEEKILESCKVYKRIYAVCRHFCCKRVVNGFYVLCSIL